MSLGKIDPVKLNQLLRQGKTVKLCAKFFGVTPGAVSQSKKKLNVSVVKNIALENAHRIVDKSLNAVAQLQKINENANELLDLLMRWNRGENEALQILESQVRRVKIGESEKLEIKEVKFKDPRELALKAMAEIRGQLKLQLEIFQTLYDMQAVQEFQIEVLNTIAEVDPDVRSKIVDRLSKKRAVRSAIQFS